MNRPRRVLLLTGSREWSAVEPVQTVLRWLDGPDDKLIVGDARGLDRIAFTFAEHAGIRADCYAAFWGLLGFGAGHERNGRMVRAAAVLLAFGADVQCVGFTLPGCRGTLNCMAQARAALGADRVHEIAGGL